MDIAKVDICFLLAEALVSWAYHISRWAPRASSALCRAPRDTDGGRSCSQLSWPIGDLSPPLLVEHLNVSS